MASFTFKVNSHCVLSSPYQKSGKNDNLETITYLLVDMQDLPEELPLDVNPREPNMKTNVARRLVDAVVNSEQDFYINNRGIVIAAKSLTFDESASEVTVDLGDSESEEDRYQYGILDGGHTYTAIMEQRAKIPEDVKQYVRVEVITNVQNITRLSDARNTSVQVSDVALFNLDDKFDQIKEVIKNLPYADKIAYKDNEDKPIHVSEFLRLMFAFDVERYPDESNILNAPTQSYSGKAQVFKRYREAYDKPFYRALVRQIPKLVELYDTILRDLCDKYVEYKKANGVSVPKFGGVRGIENNDKAVTPFLGYDIGYDISTGYVYPIFAAFRCLLRYDGEKEEVSWIFDPVKIWNEIGSSIVQTTFDSSNNPQLVGKDKQVWISNYRTVRMYRLEKQLNDK